MDPAGNLYGTTLNNGPYGYGEIYELQHSSQGWQQIYLYAFTGKADGGYPNGGLALDASGSL